MTNPSHHDLREAIAALMHTQWGEINSSILRKLTASKLGEFYTMTAKEHDRRAILATTPYHELSEADKDKDREQADRVLALLPSQGVSPGSGAWDPSKIYDPAHDCADHCVMCKGLAERRAAPKGAGSGEPAEVGEFAVPTEILEDLLEAREKAVFVERKLNTVMPLLSRLRRPAPPAGLPLAEQAQGREWVLTGDGDIGTHALAGEVLDAGAKVRVREVVEPPPASQGAEAGRPPLEEMREAAANEWTRSLVAYAFRLEAKVQALDADKRGPALDDLTRLLDYMADEVDYEESAHLNAAILAREAWRKIKETTPSAPSERAPEAPALAGAPGAVEDVDLEAVDAAMRVGWGLTSPQMVEAWERIKSRLRTHPTLKPLVSMSQEEIAAFIQSHEHEIAVARNYSAPSAPLRDAKRVEEPLEWEDGQHFNFDNSVAFGSGYDFFGLESRCQTAKTRTGAFGVWPEGHGDNAKWSAYDTVDGGLSIGGFPSETAAKSACERWHKAHQAESSPPLPAGEGSSPKTSELPGGAV